MGEWKAKSDWLLNPRNPTYDDLQNLMLDQGRSGVSAWGGDVDAGGNSLLNLAGIGCGSSGYCSVDGPSSSPGGERGTLLVTGGGPQYRLALGYNSTFDYGWIQSVHNGLSASTLVLNANGGNVVVGSTSAASRLHVYQKVNGGVSSVTIDNDGTGPGTGQAVQFRYGTYGVLGGVYHSLDPGGYWKLAFKGWNGTTQAERLTIQCDNGYVGLNTPLPVAPLHVHAGTDNNVQVRPNTINGLVGMQVLSANDANSAYGTLFMEGANLYLNAHSGMAGGRVVVSVPGRAPADAVLMNGQTSVWYDEAYNSGAGRLVFRCRKTDGTLKTYYLA